MAGYNGYSMSNNAISAYESGERPISKWTKKAIIEAVKEINSNIDLSGLSVKELKSHCLTQSSWHHTSKKYNKTDFYSIYEDVESWTQDTVENIIAARNEELNNQKIRMENMKLAKELKEKGSMIVDGCNLTYKSNFGSDFEITIESKEYLWCPEFAPGFNNMHDIYTMIASHKEGK